MLKEPVVLALSIIQGKSPLHRETQDAKLARRNQRRKPKGELIILKQYATTLRCHQISDREIRRKAIMRQLPPGHSCRLAAWPHAPAQLRTCGGAAPRFARCTPPERTCDGPGSPNQRRSDSKQRPKVTTVSEHVQRSSTTIHMSAHCLPSSLHGLQAE